MQSVSVQTAQNVNIRYEAASVGERILAFILDTIVRVLYSIAISMLMAQLGMESSELLYLLLISPALVYYLWMEIFFGGQSLAKMAMGMKVVMMDGSRPSLGAYLMRWVLRIIDVTLFTGGVAVLTILINGKGQRLGDIAANTTVVRLQKNMEVKRHELLKRMPESYEVTFDNVTQLSDTDIAVILEALSIHKTTANKKPVMAAEQRVKELCEIESDLPSVKFLYTVVKDYNFLTSGLES
jgi:uncharacterized RDD family membrane protein YckC